MTYNTGILINEILTYLAIAIWAILIILIVVQILKKDFYNLKKTILYILNSSIFYLGGIFYVRLAIIVQAPKKATKEESINILKNNCKEELINYISISILTTAILLATNFLYQKYMLNKIEIKSLSILAVIDLLLLLIMSISAVLNYYIGILGEINRYYK